MRWPKISTLIMEGFTKSNFPPRSWEGNYELLKGSPSSSSSSAGSLLFHQEISFFIYSVIFLHPESGLRPSHLVTVLGGSSWNNSPRCYFMNSLLPGRYPTLLGLPTLTLRVDVIPIPSVFFFWANFHNLATKQKRACESSKGIFEIYKKQIATFWPKEFARFRQCISAGRQN
jgi:hypothetical protein